MATDQYRMTISWTEPEIGKELLYELATIDSEDVSVSVDSVSRDGFSLCSIDIEPLTRKQLEAVRIAVEAGYYESPREACLADLAAHLDISESAVSQRLNMAERKLIIALAAASE